MRAVLSPRAVKGGFCSLAFVLTLRCYRDLSFGAVRSGFNVGSTVEQVYRNFKSFNGFRAEGLEVILILLLDILTTLNQNPKES